MSQTVEVDHNAIWTEVGHLKTQVVRLKDETNGMRLEVRDLNGKIETQFERLAGQLASLSAVLAERHEAQKKVLKDVDVLFERVRHAEVSISEINHGALEKRVTDIEEKQGTHGEKLAQVAIIGMIASAIFAAFVSSMASKIMAPSKGEAEPAPHARLAPLV